MILQINDNYRIRSTSKCYAIEIKKVKTWKIIGYQGEIKAALQFLYDLEIRDIDDKCKINEVIKLIEKFRKEIMEIVTMFKIP